MKRVFRFNSICHGVALTLSAFTFMGCVEDISGEKDSMSTTPRAVVPASAFNLWGTCSTQPYVYSNGVIVPVGSTQCNPNYVGAQQNGGQYASGLSFYGAFKGGSNAPNGSNEMAVFICDNVTTWTGREMGFVKTLNDNTLKAYLQSPGQYIWRVISSGNTGFHTYKCQVNPTYNDRVDFYVDNVYQFTLQNPGVNYRNQWYYFVGTTIRRDAGWNSTGQSIDMFSMQTH
jgi:hypothetical protein